jgi:hypothetical protein
MKRLLKVSLFFLLSAHLIYFIFSSDGSRKIFAVLACPVTAGCFLAFYFLLKRKEKSYALVLSYAVDGFLIGWIALWTLTLLSLLLTGPVPRGSQVAPGITILGWSIVSAIIGLGLGIIEVIRKKNTR